MMQEKEKSAINKAKWVEVDLEAIEHNYRQIRQKIAPEVKLLGVVKADAYGHGAVEVSRLLSAAGVDMLGVTTVEEGRALREAGIRTPILVFGAFLPEEAFLFAEFNLTATVASPEAVEWLKKAAAETRTIIKVQLKVETGLGRFGIWPREVVTVAQEIGAVPGLQLEGVYSHLATAMWRNNRYALKQFRIFQQVCAELEQAGIKGLVRHIANSAVLLKLPEMHLDMVRVGTLLYGQAPVPSLQKGLALKEAWRFKVKVIYIKKLPAGHSVGYGRTFRAKRPTTIAILPVGFTDGVQVEPVLKPAGFSDFVKGAVKLLLRYLGRTKFEGPVRFPKGTGRIIGKVGMQLTTVDITGLEGIEVGTAAILPARRTVVNPCIPKVYLHEKQGAEQVAAVGTS